MGKGGTNTVTQSAPPPQVMNAYQNALNRATQVANTPWQPYAGGNPAAYVAPLSQQQQAAIQEVANAQGMAQPYYNQAQHLIQQAQTPLWQNTMQFSPGNVMQYYNPYVQQVVNTTEQQFQNMNLQQLNALTGNAAAQGALGGNRVGVAQGVLGGQQLLSEAPQIAGLEQAGYNTALGEFNTEQQAQLGANEANAWLASQGAFGMTNLGTTAESMALQGAQAQLGTGGIQQQMAQEYLNIPYENWLAQQAYPFQTASWLANISEGLGGQMGGISSTTPMEPSLMSQIGGTALGAGAMIGYMGGLTPVMGALGLGGGAAGIGAAATAADTAMGADAALGAMGLLFKRGGRVRKFADGGETEAPPDPSTDRDWEALRNLPQQMSGFSQLAAQDAPMVTLPPLTVSARALPPPAPAPRPNAFDALQNTVNETQSGPVPDHVEGVPIAPASREGTPFAADDPWAKMEQAAVNARPDPWLTLAKIGFGIASSNSPFPLQNIGAGTMMGIQGYGRQKTNADELLARAEEARGRIQEEGNWRRAMADIQQQNADTRAERVAALNQEGAQKLDLATQRLAQMEAYQQGMLAARQMLANAQADYLNTRSAALPERLSQEEQKIQDLRAYRDRLLEERQKQIDAQAAYMGARTEAIPQRLDLERQKQEDLAAYRNQALGLRQKDIDIRQQRAIAYQDQVQALIKKWQSTGDTNALLQALALQKSQGESGAPQGASPSPPSSGQPSAVQAPSAAQRQSQAPPGPYVGQMVTLHGRTWVYTGDPSDPHGWAEVK